jgi:hypothetical protein
MRWLVGPLLALLVALLRRAARAKSLPAARVMRSAAPDWVAAPEWAVCRGCVVALTGSVRRYKDSSYCAACHAEVVELDTDE